MASIRFYEINVDSYGTHASQLSPSTVSDFQKSFLAVQQMYFLNAVLTKCSILYLYHRILLVTKDFHPSLIFLPRRCAVRVRFGHQYGSVPLHRVVYPPAVTEWFTLTYTVVVAYLTVLQWSCGQLVRLLWSTSSYACVFLCSVAHPCLISGTNHK